MKHFILYLKGAITGIGAVSPGLSGSVIMVILGLYTKTVDTIARLLPDLRDLQKTKNNLLFLAPLMFGMLTGIILFARAISFALDNFEIQTRLASLGLLIGTIPLFYYEVKRKRKLETYHFALAAIGFAIGIAIFAFVDPAYHSGDLNFFQAFTLGFAGISATVIPINGAALLSAFGLYGSWLDLTSLSNFSLSLYLPAGIGVIVGGFTLAIIVSRLLKRYYTATFSVLFGLFLSIIPSVLRSDGGHWIALDANAATYVGATLLVIGIFASYKLGGLSQKHEHGEEKLAKAPRPKSKKKEAKREQRPVGKQNS